MQLKSRSKKMIITSLDRAGLDALMQGQYEAVCQICGAIYNEKDSQFLKDLVTDCLAEDHTDEGGILWNTLWIGVSTADGTFIGAVRMMGRPTQKRELTVMLYPLGEYESPNFINVVSRVCEWSFSHRAVYYIRTQAKNEAEIRFLRRFDFKYNKIDGFFEREKNSSSWFLICLILGLASGLAVGELFGGISVGFAVGGLFGAVTGWQLDHLDISRRKPTPRNDEQV